MKNVLKILFYIKVCVKQFFLLVVDAEWSNIMFRRNNYTCTHEHKQTLKVFKKQKQLHYTCTNLKRFLYNATGEDVLMYIFQR